MKWIKALEQWRKERGLIKPQWDSIYESLKEELEELQEAYNNNDMQEVIDAYCDHIVFSVNLLGQIDINNSIFPKQEDRDYNVKSVDEINDYIKLLPSLIETHQLKLAMYVLKKIVWSCKVNIKHLGYDFDCVMNETIKEISSRQQNPIQKATWKANGSQGQKWKKDLNQAPNTLYKAEYSKCKS